MGPIAFRTGCPFDAQFRELLHDRGVGPDLRHVIERRELDGVESGLDSLPGHSREPFRTAFFRRAIDVRVVANLVTQGSTERGIRGHSQRLPLQVPQTLLQPA